MMDDVKQTGLGTMIRVATVALVLFSSLAVSSSAQVEAYYFYIEVNGVTSAASFSGFSGTKFESLFLSASSVVVTPTGASVGKPWPPDPSVVVPGQYPGSIVRVTSYATDPADRDRFRESADFCKKVALIAQVEPEKYKVLLWFQVADGQGQLSTSSNTQVQVFVHNGATTFRCGLVNK